MNFIDLTMAFDSVHGEGHWRVLKNIGCLDKFVSNVRSFHDGMMGCVLDKEEMSLHLTWPKAGLCTRTATVQHFLRHDAAGGCVFNLRRLRARTSEFSVILRDLFYADDCVLLVHSVSVFQQVFDRFSNAAHGFGLTVSLKKAEVMLQQNRS